MSRAINQIQKARKTLKNTSMKYPDDYEIAKMTGLSLDKIRSASNCLRVVASINQKMGDFSVEYMVRLIFFLLPLLLATDLFLLCCDLTSNFVLIIVIFVIEKETKGAIPVHAWEYEKGPVPLGKGK